MKRPQPDIGDTLRASFISDMSTINRIKRFWGADTVNGVEVFKHKQYYYPDNYKSPEFEDLFRFLGAYENVTAFDPRGVESAWLYFNKNNNTTLVDYPEFITSNLNQLWWDDSDGVMPSGLTLTTNIVIEAKQTSASDTSIRTSELLSPSSSKAQLMLDIAANYEALWDTCLISQQGVGVINKGSITDSVTAHVTPDEDDLSPNDPWLEVISRYALRTNGIPCTIKDVSIGIGTEGPRLYSTYIVTIEIPYNAFSVGEVFVSDIFDDLDTTYASVLGTRLSYTNGYWTKKAIQSMDASGLEDGTVVTRPYRLWETEAAESDALYDALWYNYAGNWYLRAAPFSDPRSYGLTHRQLTQYVLQLVDTGYQKKKAPWWKELLAIVVFVVAVVLAPVSGGGSIAALSSAGGVALAQAVVFASLVLSLATAVLSAVGADEWALAFSQASKTLAPLAQVASIYLAITGLGDLVGKLSEGTLGTIVEGEITSFVDEIVKGATDVMSGNFKDVSLEFMAKAVDILTLPERNKLATLQSKNKDLKAEYDKLVEEGSREHDVLRGFSKVYAKPATADWSMYASLYDTPYERGGGNLSIGNIQKTTKQALRKADYNDPMFENTLVM
jgi:hypothetical protein